VHWRPKGLFVPEVEMAGGDQPDGGSVGAAYRDSSFAVRVRKGPQALVTVEGGVDGPFAAQLNTPLR
jgi:hypothetical protein